MVNTCSLGAGALASELRLLGVMVIKVCCEVEQTLQVDP